MYLYFLSHLPCYNFILVSTPTIFVFVLFVQFIRLHVLSIFFFHRFCHLNLRYTFHVTFVKPLYFSMATAFAVATTTIVFVYITYHSIASKNKTMNHNTDSTDKYSLTIKWGEPLSNTLRYQRFQSFLNDMPHPNTWDLSFPDSHTNYFCARFESDNNDMHQSCMNFLREFEKKHVIPHSRAKSSTPFQHQNSMCPPPSNDIVNTKCAKHAEITLTSNRVIKYPIGYFDIQFHENPAQMDQRASIVHKSHSLWLRGQELIDWRQYRDLSNNYITDPSLSKTRRKKL